MDSRSAEEEAYSRAVAALLFSQAVRGSFCEHHWCKAMDHVVWDMSNVLSFGRRRGAQCGTQPIIGSNPLFNDYTSVLDTARASGARW